ncbi:hypothetical protein Bca52824_077863, partial [Brassica carinata]
RLGSVSMDANSGLRDAISWLPDEVLGKILSLLPTKQAASTSVLAKKWRHVFRLVHTLDFDDSVLLQPGEGKEECPVIRESFRNFVERTLALQCGSPINKFSLKFHIHEMKEMSHMFSWICNALERALKSLFIDSVVFIGDDLCGVLLRGFPLLEELFVRHEKCEGTPFYIYNPTIKKLSVYYDFGLVRDGGMSFDTPSLVSLDYSDYAARLDIRYTKRIKKLDLSGLIIGIRNVHTLHLSPASTDVISRCVEEGLVLPMFKNLVSLTFGSYNERGWKLLLDLHKQSPKLETLNVQGLDGNAGDVRIHPFQVKVEELVKHLNSFLG